MAVVQDDLVERDDMTRSTSRRRRWLASLAVITLAATAPRAHAQPSPDSLRAELDARVPGWLASAKVPSIAVAYIRNGRVAWTRVYGEQSPGVPATRRTLYNVASLTKPVFAELMLRLAAQGRLTLDEPMSNAWIDPDLASDTLARLLTVRSALAHRTGFANWRHLTGGRLTFAFTPGTGYGYSGEGYEYASRFAQRRLGASTLEEVGRRHLLEPLGMRSTAFAPQPWFEGRVALPMGPEGAYGKPSFAARGNAADDLYTTIDDYARFVTHVIARRGLPDSLGRQRDSLHVLDVSPASACDPARVPVCPARIGHTLGWAIMEYAGNPVLWHTGADWGERSMVIRFGGTGHGAVLLTNGVNGFDVAIDVGILLFADTPFAGYLRTGKQ